MIRFVLASAVAISISSSAAAGTFRVLTLSFPATTQSVDEVLESSELGPMKLAGGNWSFAFKDKSSVLAPLTLSIRVPPSDYEPFSLTFDVPYYWDRPSPQTIAVALASDPKSLQGTRNFLNNTSVVPSDAGNLFLVNQRARRIFAARQAMISAGGQVPDSNDGAVAYWLLVTTQELVRRYYSQIDSVSRLAMDWSSGLIQDQATASRVFIGAPLDTMKKIISFLGERDAYVYNRLIQQISSDISADSEVISEAACPRAQRLHDLFQSVPLDQRPSVNGQFENMLRAAENAALCKAREVTAAGAGLSPQDRASAEALAGQVKDLVDIPRANASAAVSRAISRNSELVRALSRRF